MKLVKIVVFALVCLSLGAGGGWWLGTQYGKRDPYEDVRNGLEETIAKLAQAKPETRLEALELISSLETRWFGYRWNIRDRLIYLLYDPSLTDEEREKAFFNLSSIGSQSRKALPEFEALSRSKNAHVRACMAEVMRDVYPTGDVAASRVLLRLLKDEEEEVRWQAAISLKYQAPNTPEAIPALIDALDDSSPRVLEYVIGALRQFGSQATDATPRLVELHVDGDRRLRTLVETAVAELGATSETDRAYFRGLLESEDSLQRYMAAFTVSHLERNEQALAMLAEFIRIGTSDAEIASAFPEQKKRRGDDFGPFAGSVRDMQIQAAASLLEAEMETKLALERLVGDLASMPSVNVEVAADILAEHPQHAATSIPALEQALVKIDAKTEPEHGSLYFDEKISLNRALRKLRSSVED